MSEKVKAAEAELLENEALKLAFKALWRFCVYEMRWNYFRTEFLEDQKDSPSVTIKNAKKLSDYMNHLRREQPAVDRLVTELERRDDR